MREIGCHRLKAITLLSFHSGRKQKKKFLGNMPKNLESKICIVCNIPFNWRKKWEKNWAEVKYCSERCRRNKKDYRRI